MNANTPDAWSRLAFAGLPEEQQWKAWLLAGLNGGEKLSEWQQQALQQWREAWQQRAGAASWLELGRQCDDTWTEYARQCLLWQLQWAAAWRGQGYKLHQALQEARGDGDALLALNAASQEGRQLWDERMESLQQTLYGLHPALAQSLRQWLTQAPTEAELLQS
ncbi:hypothetical protein [Chromobacterium sp. ASV23]|uniref:hypothetical protein n=1 Tax=Chromobacterium sp. ASV23 TaxID=2795110 RepID=UPI0018EE16F1|nr:hypothetical protein [Chromobacterium sp. ASV23]